MAFLRGIGVLLGAILLTASASGGASAADGDPISVKVNMARILRISAPAATVIIGNPGVADVTIQDPQTLVLTGKSYGQTNLIVLDNMGNPIADTLVDVIQAQADVVTVYMGGPHDARLHVDLPADDHAGRRSQLHLGGGRLLEHRRGRGPIGLPAVYHAPDERKMRGSRLTFA